MPGSGAALTGADMDRIVADLKDLGANVTRAHYLMNDRLLSRFDRAGILVWNQSPIWQRDHGARSLPGEGARARAADRAPHGHRRAQPPVGADALGGKRAELHAGPKPGHRRFLLKPQEQAREIDPTLPISVDIKGRPGFAEQFTYHSFDLIGVNQYFGWYRWVEDFSLLEPYIRELRDLYPARRS